jgi:asparagine synthase (glutamine-hydrolysing)
MCGIAGFSNSLVFTIDCASLNASLEILAHRGPDDSGIFEDKAGGIGLVHTRLSIQDTSSFGHQPMQTSDGSVTIVFNGEIYNFLEIRRMLTLKGVEFQGHSDTEVLLNLYLDEGEAMLSRLNGIFAFALYDKRKQALLVARDALGVKPFYYSAENDRFVFSSEIKGLLPHLQGGAELDIESLHLYLSFLYCPGDGTPLKSVKKLGPGEAMWVKMGAVQRHWVWYQLPICRGKVPNLSKSMAIDGTRNHLRQAVQRQMISDVPVGAFLSGGLDSSAIVAFARELNPNIRCFTIESIGGHDEGFVDDLPYAKRVAKHLNVELDVVSIDSQGMARDLEAMVEKMDEPIADPAALNVFYISQLARSQGIKVLLSGAGGDDLFTGYRRHHAINLEKYWTWLPVQYRKKIEHLTERLDQRNPFFRRLNKLLCGSSYSGDNRIVNYFSWTKESTLFQLYSPELIEALGDKAAANPMLEFLQAIPVGQSSLERMLALEQRFFLTDHNLLYTDKMSMAAGVEVRVPFLDIDLVEFASQIPINFKQRGADGKWVLKKAMEGYLPDEIIYRKKTGFGAPLRKWMRNDLREMLGDLLSAESVKRRGLFDSVKVQKMISRNDTGEIDASYTLLSLLCIEIWCRKFMDTPINLKHGVFNEKR